MRKNQSKLKQQVKALEQQAFVAKNLAECDLLVIRNKDEEIGKLQRQVSLLKRKLKHRERVITYLSNKLKAQEHEWTPGVMPIDYNPMPF